jgi:hypothetical protein
MDVEDCYDMEPISSGKEFLYFLLNLAVSS